MPSDRSDVLLDAAKLGLRREWRVGSPATHMHLVASDLKRQDGGQQSLFDPDFRKLAAVAKAKREINERFGRFTLRRGATLFANAFYQDPANHHDVCDIRGKFCF